MTLEQFQFLDIGIKGVALIGAAISVGIAFLSASYSKRKTRYEFLQDLYKDFLSPEVVQVRNAVANFWLQEKVKANSPSEGGCIALPELSQLSDQDIPAFLTARLGITFEEIDKAYLIAHPTEVANTEEVLNRYEHLAKLVELRVISSKEVKTFFYTMLADTFIVCLPFILFRRKSKPSYAHKMQVLLKRLPKVSKDLARV